MKWPLNTTISNRRHKILIKSVFLGGGGGGEFLLYKIRTNKTKIPICFYGHRRQDENKCQIHFLKDLSLMMLEYQQ